MFTFIALLIVLLNINNSECKSYDPEQIHLSFGSNDYNDIFVSWASTGTNKKPSISPYVTYGTKSSEYTFNSTSHIYTYTDGGWIGLLYNSQLTALKQNTRYYYKIISSSSSSKEYSFLFNHPLQLPSEPFQFLLIGDMGEALVSNACVNSNGCSNDTIIALKNETHDNNSAEYSLLLHVGDIAYTSGDETIWDTYFNQIEDITTTLPYMVCDGNHEHYYNFTGYKSRFNMINASTNKGETNLYYSFIYGGIYFLSYSTEHNFSVGSTQYNFIINDLKKNENNNNIKWRILYGHRPIYCSTSDEYDCKQNGPDHIEPVFEPLLKKYNFDLYFAGHLHNYERAYSVYNFTNITINADKDIYVNPLHTINVVIGMSGDTEGLTNSWYTQPEWSAYRIAKLGYGKITVYNQTNLLFQFIESGTMKINDQFMIQKEIK